LSRFGDLAGVGYTSSRLSLTAFVEGNYTEADELGRVGLEKFTEIGHVWGMGVSNCRIGFAALELGDLEQAEPCFREALRRAQEVQHTPLILYALAGFGDLLALLGQVERGVELIACVLAHPMTPLVYRELAERHLPEFEKTQGSEIFKVAQKRGRASDLEQVLLALSPEKMTV
jgi:tetratricopeptide (TPR) repeat protein